MITTTVIYDHKKRAKDEPGMIEVRCTINRKTYYIGTGVRVHKENFVGGSVVNQLDAVELNKRIGIVYVKVTEELNRAMAAGEDIDMTEIRRRTWMMAEDASQDGAPFVDWVRKQMEALRLKDGTMKHYVTLVMRLEQFGELRRWSDLTLEKLYDWDAWLHRLPARQSTADKNAGIQAECISDAAVYNYHKCLKALLNRAVMFGKIDRNPYDRLRGKFKRGDRESVVYLSEDEMRAFMETAAPSGSAMAVAHDLFAFQMFTGLSYSDTQAFDMSEYKQVDGRWVNVGERVKTGVAYVSQLLPPAVEVLEKYGMKVPKLSNADYNRCLKALGMVAGIKTPLHSHVARHTFATYMLRNGAKIQNVSAMLGHTNIKQTQRYAKVVAQSVRDDFTMIEEKLTLTNSKNKAK